MNPPLIFIHYGESSHLKYTLESAVFFNPDKRVILLGDRGNSHHSALGVEHLNCEDYASGPEIELFDSLYIHAAGARDDSPQWPRLAYRRWFILHNFLREHELETFWTVDSDTLVLTNLTAQEAKFLSYDCTEECAGLCMNGFVTNRQVVRDYVYKINELFQTEGFLTKPQLELRNHPRTAFAEAEAYEVYRAESNFRRASLNTISDGEAFMESLYAPDERKGPSADEYEQYAEKYWGRDVRKVYGSEDGAIFMFHVPSQKLVRLNTINMGCVPDSLYEALLRQAKRKPSAPSSPGTDRRKVGVLNINQVCRNLSAPAGDEKAAARQELPVTEKLLQKLKRLRSEDPNIYPLF